ncbi:hypothetical protein ABEX08_29870, partial [Priestia megaterium]
GLGDGGKIFRKVNPFVFLMLIPSFILLIFCLPCMNYFSSTHPVAPFASSAQLPYRFHEGLH